jgi:hypothetical protein
VLSCKESACKATGGSTAVHDVAIAMDGEWPRGLARTVGTALGAVALWWDATPGHILTVGVAGPSGEARQILDRIIRERGVAESV